MRAFLYLVVLLLLGSCANKKRLPVEYSDPYLQSFRGKNIRYVIIYKDPILPPDTLYLDEYGNIIRVRTPFNLERRVYDENNFLVRLWHHEDYSTSLKINYNWRGDTLIQTWRAVKPSTWEITGDTSSRKDRTVRYIFNKNGKIWEERNPSDNALFKYIYDDHDRLVRKNRFRLHPRGETMYWLYDYDDEGGIKRIAEYLLNGEIWNVQYFTKGLLDSATYKDFGPIEETRRYQYIYY